MRSTMTWSKVTRSSMDEACWEDSSASFCRRLQGSGEPPSLFSLRMLLSRLRCELSSRFSDFIFLCRRPKHFEMESKINGSGLSACAAGSPSAFQAQFPTIISHYFPMSHLPLRSFHSSWVAPSYPDSCAARAPHPATPSTQSLITWMAVLETNSLSTQETW